MAVSKYTFLFLKSEGHVQGPAWQSHHDYMCATGIATVTLSTALAQRGAASFSWLSSIRRCHVKLTHTHTCCSQAPAPTSAGKQPLLRRNPTQQWITAAFVKTKVLLSFIYFPCAQQMLWWQEQDNQKLPFPSKMPHFLRTGHHYSPGVFSSKQQILATFLRGLNTPSGDAQAPSNAEQSLDKLFSRKNWGFERKHCSKDPQTQLLPTVAAAAMAAHLPLKQEPTAWTWQHSVSPTSAMAWKCPQLCWCACLAC